MQSAHTMPKTKAIRMTLPVASILAVGTEVTSGQITNRNAAWLAQKLEDQGVHAPFHLTVPDDRAQIRDALELCAQRSDWIFVTGGLGPTTDDFTREVISNFVDEPLEFHEASWHRIQDRLSRAGIRVAESNRQQCYYPHGSQVLTNPAGTANGFKSSWKTSSRSGLLFVLPGPPREITAVWEEGLAKELIALLPARSPTRLMTWQCLGKSEAELGEIVESAVKGASLKTGYRVHRPYVEVKIWADEPLSASAQAGLEKLEEAIAPWMLVRGDTDLAQAFLECAKQLQALDWHFWDGSTQGILVERFAGALRKTDSSSLSVHASLSPSSHASHSPGRSSLSLEAKDPNLTQWAWHLVVPQAGIDVEQRFTTPFKIPQVDLSLASEREIQKSFLDRVLRFAAETALAQAYRCLNTSRR